MHSDATASAFRFSRSAPSASSPPGVFDDAATEAVRQWRYQPALYRGRPVKVWAEQVVHFELS